MRNGSAGLSQTGGRRDPQDDDGEEGVEWVTISDDGMPMRHETHHGGKEKESRDVLTPQCSDGLILRLCIAENVGSICVQEYLLGCGIPVCVSKGGGDHGCIDASPNPVTGDVKVTKATFLCPQCHHAVGKPIQYQVQGYSVRQDFLYCNYFPLLTIFLTGSGFGTQYASNVMRTSLLEHFSLDPTRLCIASRALKAGNNRPAAMTPHFQWLSRLNNEDMGNLVVSGNAKNPESVPIHELLANYLGSSNLRPAMEAIAAINKSMGAGPEVSYKCKCTEML
ncbi:hypothetical protein BD769DRAFT_1384256 [Suillus cothurnatus]|nr:hypothetical protein BD769DRAFT_1384256 [Suillus cothurnatus]